MKIFISQPMNGLTEVKVLSQRNLVAQLLKGLFRDEVVIMDTYFDDYQVAQCKNKGLAYLAKSLEYLADADLAVFIGNWETARGCLIEHQCAKGYGIPIMELTNMELTK